MAVCFQACPSVETHLCFFNTHTDNLWFKLQLCHAELSLLTTAIESSALLFNPLADIQYQAVSFLDKPTTKYDLYLVGTLSTVLKK